MLYKFLSVDRIDVLKNLKIRFTQPSELNDPFESAILVDAGNLVNFEDSIKELDKLDPQDEEEHNMVERAKKEMREYAMQEMLPLVMGRKLIDNLNRAQGTLSLSRANNNLLMWSHYGSSHKGYVIGFDESHEWFRALNGFGKAGKLHNVIYSSRRSIVKVGSEDFYERLLCYKSIEWAYEEEVRIFKTFGSTKEHFEKNTSDQIHLMDIPKDCIQEIFIGANASEKMRSEIFQAIEINKLNVKIFEAYINEDRYEINFRTALK